MNKVTLLWFMSICCINGLHYIREDDKITYDDMKAYMVFKRYMHDINTRSQTERRQARQKRQKCMNKSPYCKEVAGFVPGMCEFESAKRLCRCICNTEDKNKDMLKCGKRNKNGIQGSIQKRMIGGKISKQREWPWVVSLNASSKILNGGNRYWCVGTILSEHFVASASHCFYDKVTSMKAEDWTVAVGNDLSKTFETRVRVKKRIFYRGSNTRYILVGGKQFDYSPYDIVLLKLEKPLDLTNPQIAAPLCLAVGNDQEDERCFSAGWGFNKVPDISLVDNIVDRQRYMRMPVQPESVCNADNMFRKAMRKENLCAGYNVYPYKGLCADDSGAALACEGQHGWFLRGIASGGFPCIGYTTYTRVNLFKKWIAHTILNET